MQLVLLVIVINGFIYLGVWFVGVMGLYGSGLDKLDIEYFIVND